MYWVCIKFREHDPVSCKSFLDSEPIISVRYRDTYVIPSSTHLYNFQGTINSVSLSKKAEQVLPGSLGKKSSQKECGEIITFPVHGKTLKIMELERPSSNTLIITNITWIGKRRSHAWKRLNNRYQSLHTPAVHSVGFLVPTCLYWFCLNKHQNL